jgi:hypothetical protein
MEFGYTSALDRQGRTIWIVDAHGNGKRFIVRSDEQLTAFIELQLAIGVYEPIHVDIADLGPRVSAFT